MGPVAAPTATYSTRGAPACAGTVATTGAPTVGPDAAPTHNAANRPLPTPYGGVTPTSSRAAPLTAETDTVVGTPAADAGTLSTQYAVCPVAASAPPAATPSARSEVATAPGDGCGDPTFAGAPSMDAAVRVYVDDAQPATCTKTVTLGGAQHADVTGAHVTVSAAPAPCVDVAPGAGVKAPPAAGGDSDSARSASPVSDVKFTTTP